MREKERDEEREREREREVWCFCSVGSYNLLSDREGGRGGEGGEGEDRHRKLRPKSRKNTNMFDGGVPEQFHQFIASTRTTPPSSTLPLPLSAFSASASSPSLHHHASSNNATTFPPFDSLYPPPLQPHFLHHHHPLHHHPSPTQKSSDKQEDRPTSLVQAMDLEIEIRERPAPVSNDQPWTNDEVLALLRIRSSMENWFPEFTWDHVARKLAELGFKRSAEKCKDKFEEESRCFNNNNYKISNYRIFSELDELCHGDRHQRKKKPSQEEEEHNKNLEEESRDEQTVEKVMKESVISVAKRSKKRKRLEKFEMLKGLCEEMVKKMMAQQEEMHNKLLEDMMKRDEEKVAREEAWKKQEMDRINQELEIRAHEQALAGDRQAMIINFLKKFVPTSGSFERRTEDDVAENPSSTSHGNKQRKAEVPMSSATVPGDQRDQNPSSSALTASTQKVPTSSSSPALTPQNPNSVNSRENPLEPTSASVNQATVRNPTLNDKEDLGKRWPRDEVLALINLRCSLHGINSEDQKEGGGNNKAPLWERISQGMLELGYRRSAKRCKEKWENINKYFRKTKDINKKRSLDSRTCPYFQQLSTLYSQGTLVAPPPTTTRGSENLHSSQPGKNPETLNRQDGYSDSIIHVAEAGDQKIQVPSFDFEF